MIITKIITITIGVDDDYYNDKNTMATTAMIIKMMVISIMMIKSLNGFFYKIN